MKIRSILLVFASVAAVLGIPGAVAGGADPSCEEATLAVGASSKVLTAVWCSPSEAQVGQTFRVSAYVQLATGSLLIALEPASAWLFDGCSLVSSADRDATLSQSTVAVVSMDEAACSIVAYATEGILGANIEFPMLFSVYDPTYDLPTDFTNTVDVTAWPGLDITSWPSLDVDVLSIPQLSVLLGGSVDVALDGAVTVDGMPTAFTVTNDGTLALTGIPTAYSVDVTGITVDQQFDNATIQNTFVDAWTDWLPILFFVFLILYGESRRNPLASFAGVVGLISEFIVGGVASRSFFIFLGMIAVAFSSFVRAWFGKRGRE